MSAAAPPLDSDPSNPIVLKIEIFETRDTAIDVVRETPEPIGISPSDLILHLEAALSSLLSCVMEG